MKRVSEGSGADSSAPSAQRPRIDPAGSSARPSLGKSVDATPPIDDGLGGLGDVLEAVVSTTRKVQLLRGHMIQLDQQYLDQQYQASLLSRPAQGANKTPASPETVLQFIETRRAGRQSVKTLIDELHHLRSEMLENFEAEITVPTLTHASENGGADFSAAQRPRVDPAGSSALPSSSLGKSVDVVPPTLNGLGGKSVYATPPTHDGPGGKSQSVDATPPTHDGLGGFVDVLEAVVSTTRKVQQYQASLASRPAQETPASPDETVLKFLQTRRADFQSVQTLIYELDLLKSDWLDLFELEAEITVLNIGSEALLEKAEVCSQFWSSVSDDMLHRLFHPTVQHVLDAIWERVDGIVAQCRDEERAVREEGQAYERAYERALNKEAVATQERVRGLILSELREPVRAAFLERLEKKTNPDAGLAPLVKHRLKNHPLTGPSFRDDRYQRTGIILLPDGGDPAAAEPCHPDDRLIELLTSKSADGSARGEWKWLGLGRVEMQFYAMIQLQGA